MTKKKRKPKKPTKTQLKRKADKFFSLFIRDRDGVCQAAGYEDRSENCESPYYLQCAHVFSRGYLATRLDPRNAVALCRSCHMYFTNNPIEEAEFFKWRLGEDLYEELRVKARDGKRNNEIPDWATEADHWERVWLTGQG